MIKFCFTPTSDSHVSGIVEYQSVEEIMGTSTIFKRSNDFGGRLADMSKEELEMLDKLSPWKEDKDFVRGWSAIMELHNGNFNPLIWRYGRLFSLDDAPKILTKKYYSRYRGKTMREYEWTLLRRYLDAKLELWIKN